MLWAEGYREQADQIADRLLFMMEQREEILENYNSDPGMNGGGEMDYSWSFASYMNLESRAYRVSTLQPYGTATLGTGCDPDGKP
jgi:hypothetical protein